MNYQLPSRWRLLRIPLDLSIHHASLVVQIHAAAMSARMRALWHHTLMIFSISSPSPQNHANPHARIPVWLLQRNKPRRVGGTDTGTTVLDGLVRDGEFGEVVADHLRLDLDLVEFLAGVDADDGADHLGDDDHVAQVRLDEIGLLVGLGLLLRLAQLLDQTHRTALETAVESAAGAGMEDVQEVIGGDVEESVDIWVSFYFPLLAHNMVEWKMIERWVGGVWGRHTGRGQCHGRKTCGKLSFS